MRGQGRILRVVALHPLEQRRSVGLGNGIVDLEVAFVVDGDEIWLHRLLALGIVVQGRTIIGGLDLALLDILKQLAANAALGHALGAAQTAPGMAAQILAARAAATVSRGGNAAAVFRAVLVPDGMKIRDGAADAVARDEDAGPGLAANSGSNVAADLFGAIALWARKLLKSHRRRCANGSQGKGNDL